MLSCRSGSPGHGGEAEKPRIRAVLAVPLRAAFPGPGSSDSILRHCSPCSCSAVGEPLSLFLRDLGTCLQHHVDHTEPLVPAGAKREAGPNSLSVRWKPAHPYLLSARPLPRSFREGSSNISIQLQGAVENQPLSYAVCCK